MNNRSTDIPLQSGRIIDISLLIICQSFHALTQGGITLFLPLIHKDLGLRSAATLRATVSYSLL